MSEKILPFNITLLQLTDELVQGIKPVTVLDIFDTHTKNFASEGLFSTEIFGKVGSKDRMMRFSYIQLNINILHPIIYNAIVNLKSFYGDIFKGTQYALFDESTKSFVKATPDEGKTGYNFMIKHLPSLRFEHNSSDKRELKIELIEKFKEKALTNRIVVIPAGYRDFSVGEDNRPTEDEINSIYRKFISKNNLLTKNIKQNESPEYDSIAYSLQETFNDLYDYIKNMLSGKNKLILGKWAARRVYNSTRNVASAPMLKVYDLDSEDSVKMDETQIGLYQYIKATAPITIHHLKTKFLNDRILGNGNALLINKKTLKEESLVLNNNELTRWFTDEGLEKVINSFSIEDVRPLPVVIDDHYLKLVCRKDNKVFLINDIDEIPGSLSTDICYPISYQELFYLAVGNDYKNHPGFLTRYPITGAGSIYPSYIYLRTTVHADRVSLVDKNDTTKVIENLSQYPRPNENYFDTIAVSPIHMRRLDLDFDGDTMSFTAVFSDQSVQEIRKLLNSTKFYKDFRGNLSFGSGYDTAAYVIKNVTANPEG
jgi:hypothetical protein